MAETYGIFDYKAMKPSLVATLAVGLPDRSRIKRKYSGINLTIEQMLLAMIEDSLNGLIWGLGGKRKGKKPPSILEKFMEKDKGDELMAFSTPEEYEAFMAKKRKRWQNG